MKEDRDMFNTVRASRETDGSSEAITTELSTLPTEALARLDRLATASVLASGLAHEIANPLSCLLGAMDAIERRRGRCVEVNRRGTRAAGNQEQRIGRLVETDGRHARDEQFDPAPVWRCVIFRHREVAAFGRHRQHAGGMFQAAGLQRETGISGATSER